MAREFLIILVRTVLGALVIMMLLIPIYLYVNHTQGSEALIQCLLGTYTLAMFVSFIMNVLSD